MKFIFATFALFVIIYAVQCQEVEIEITADENGWGVDPGFSKHPKNNSNLCEFNLISLI